MNVSLRVDWLTFERGWRLKSFGLETLLLGTERSQLRWLNNLIRTSPGLESSEHAQLGQTQNTLKGFCILSGSNILLTKYS